MMIGVDIGGTKCVVCKGDLEQGIVERRVFPIYHEICMQLEERIFGEN